MQIEKSIFREYDIRGREDEKELNEHSIELIARAYGTFLRRRNIRELVIGHDNRSTSESFQAAAIKGLLSTGCHIIDLGIILTPMMYWGQYYCKTKGGMAVTASHNPAGWNGVKLATGFSSTTNSEELQELYQMILADDFIEDDGGTVTKQDINDAYMTDLLSRVHIRPGFRVVVNTGNGTAGIIAPELLRRAGCEVIDHLTNLDSSYPHYTPNPADVIMMDDTGSVVREKQADFGFAFDGDGDRLGLTDEQGALIWPDRYLILLARLALERQPGAKIVFDVKCSQALPEDIKAHGGVPVMWKTGHTYIKEKLDEIGGALGGELSGHMFFMENYYGFDDALFASLNLLQYFSSSNKKVSELIAETPHYISSPAWHAECPDDKKYDVVKELTEEFKKEYEVININGARVQFSDGWGLVRASSNIPALVLRFEAKTDEGLQRIENLFREKLGRYDFVGKDWIAA